MVKSWSPWRKVIVARFKLDIFGIGGLPLISRRHMAWARGRKFIQEKRSFKLASKSWNRVGVEILKR